MAKPCAKCAELQIKAGPLTATYTYGGTTHTHPACPVLASGRGTS